MRQFLAALPEPLLTFELYDSFIIALSTPPTCLGALQPHMQAFTAFVELEDRLEYWRSMVAALPSGFRVTAEKTLSVLHLLHTHATGQFLSNGNVRTFSPHRAPILLECPCIFGNTDLRHTVRCQFGASFCAHLSPTIPSGPLHG